MVYSATKSIRKTRLDFSGSAYKKELGVEENPKGVYSKVTEGWSYDENTNTLTLNGLNLETNDAIALMVSNDCKIVLEDDVSNSIVSNSPYSASEAISIGVKAEKLTIRGNTGILNVRGGIRNPPME